QAEKKKWAKKAKELPEGPEKEEAKRQEEQYDLLQLTKKISMNSLYGALLNVAFRFGDERMGASVTASGRAITTFMTETIGEVLTGKKHFLEKRYDPKDEDIRRYTIEQWQMLPVAPVIMSDGKPSPAVYKPLMWEND